MKTWPIILLVFLLVACSTPRTDEPATAQNEPKLIPSTSIELSDLGEAPELNNQVWLNTDQPLRLAELRGQVVLLDMWTFG